MQVSEAIADILKREGVEQVFCFPLTPILDSLADAGIRPIIARQERVAENMADGFSRASCGERIGVVSVQHNAGAENAFSGIAQAMTDSSPILFLPGHAGMERVGVRPTFDAVENYSATTKWADRIPTANSVVDRMRRAFTLLRSGRPGPVLLEIPIDVACENLEGPLDYRPVRPVRTSGDPRGISNAVQLLLDAKRPMIWAGQGVLYAQASAELTTIAEQLDAPVMTTLLGKSAFDERHPLSLGTGSYTSTDMVKDYLQQCDTILAVGCSLTRTVFAPEIPAERKIIHVTVDACDLNKDYPAEVGVLGDARLVLQEMIRQLSERQSDEPQQRRTGGLLSSEAEVHSEAAAHIASVRRSWQQRWQPKLTSNQVPLNPYRIIGDFLKTMSPEDMIVTHDSGSPRDQLVPLYESVTPRGYLGWGHSTQLGFSLGAAMGAKLAAPEKTVVNFMGDAAFGMVGMDLETAVREQIPILTILLNNSAMGNYERHIPKAVEKYGTKRLSGNYADVARSLGAHAERVEQPGEILPALKRALDATHDAQPALIELITVEEPDLAFTRT